MFNLPDLRLPTGQAIGASAPSAGLAAAGQPPGSEPAEGTTAAEFAALVLLLGGALPEMAPTGTPAGAVPGASPGVPGAAGPAAGQFATSPQGASVLAAGGKTLPLDGTLLPVGTQVAAGTQASVGNQVPAGTYPPSEALVDELLAPLAEPLSEPDPAMRQLERVLGLAGARAGDLPTGLWLPVAAGGAGTPVGSAAIGAASTGTGLAVGSLPLPAPGVSGFEQALGQRLIWMAGQGVQDARIRVVPEHLGPIDIRIRMDGDATQIVLASPNSAARDALELALPRLREQLGDAGLQLVQAEVGGQDARAGEGREDGAAARNPLLGADSGEDDPAGSVVVARLRGGAGLLDLFA